MTKKQLCQIKKIMQDRNHYARCVFSMPDASKLCQIWHTLCQVETTAHVFVFTKSDGFNEMITGVWINVHTNGKTDRQIFIHGDAKMLLKTSNGNMFCCPLIQNYDNCRRFQQKVG